MELNSVQAGVARQHLDRPDRVRSRRQLANILCVSLSTLARREREGDVPKKTQLSTRRYGYRDSSIAAFLDSKTEK